MTDTLLKRRRSRTTDDLPDRGSGMLAAWRQGLAHRHLELGDSSEQRVLKLGLRRLYEGLTARHRGELMTLPTRMNGSQLIMTPSFFVRLLKDDVELKSCCPSDVSASQRDLRYLSCDQLLAIRFGTLDFVTESGSHSAHSNFLFSLDTHLFGKLAPRCMRDGVLPAPAPPEEAIRALSERIALIVGASVSLRAEEERRGTRREVPTCWAIALSAEHWAGARAALFHSDELQVDIVAGERPDFARAAAGKQIAIVQARTSVLGRDKRMFWRIALHAPTDDILAEMDLAANGGDRQQQLLAEELGSALKSRVGKIHSHSQVLQLERQLFCRQQQPQGEAPPPLNRSF